MNIIKNPLINIMNLLKKKKKKRTKKIKKKKKKKTKRKKKTPIELKGKKNKYQKKYVYFQEK
jgi:hypothetical protein